LKFHPERFRKFYSEFTTDSQWMLAVFGSFRMCSWWLSERYRFGS
jgi:hypothetical protein